MKPYWNHTIKLTKGHYGWFNAEELIYVLKVIQSHVCAIDIERVSNYDILTILLMIIEETFDKHQYQSLLKEVYKRKYDDPILKRHINTIEDDINFLVGEISMLHVLDDDKNVILELEENDPQIEKLIDNLYNSKQSIAE